MRLPNFLIIGAAKAGTSSLFAYMGQHPDVFISSAKEPNFFALEGQAVAFAGPGDDIINQASITDLPTYEALFAGVRGQAAVGEASTLYLYATAAAAGIKRYVPDVKLIAILRDPVERAYSSFLHLQRDGREPCASFEAALDQEDLRIRNHWEHLWHYTKVGYYHAQLRRYYDLFPREQIAVWLYDDFEADPTRVLREVFAFLGIDPTYAPDMTFRHKVAGTPRSRALHAVLTRPNAAKALAKRLLPAHVRSTLYAAMMQRNIVTHRDPLPEGVRRRLRELYRPDVEQLSGLIGRDLSAWLA